MPITTLDPFGGVTLSDFNVTVKPLPVDADVRIWVDGVETALQKTIGYHLEGETEETQITFRKNGVIIEPEEGYIDYTDYYYIQASKNDSVSITITHPGRSPWIDAFSVTKNVIKTVDLSRNTLHLMVLANIGEAELLVVNEQNVQVATGTGIINVDLPFSQIYTCTATAPNYKPAAKSFTLDDDKTIQMLLYPIEETGTLTLTPTNAPESEAQFYSQEESALYGWTSTTDSSVTYYTKTSVPQVGDLLYDETGHSIDKVITAYDPATGIEYTDL